MTLRSTSAQHLDSLALLSHPGRRPSPALARALLTYAQRGVRHALRQRGVDGCHGDDVVQEVCMRVLQEFAAWDPNRGAFHTWVAYRVRWSVADRLRQMFRVHTLDADDVELATPRDSDELLRDAARERVLLALPHQVKSLPPRERACIEATLAGAKLRVMAQQLGVDASGVCRLRQQAVARLERTLRQAA
jgi:RNA polymerase sigma factor (sigma-70 family)